MNPAMILQALQLFQSGKLDGVLNGIPGFDKFLGPLKDILGEQKAASNVTAAIQILADAMPEQQSTRETYLQAITQAINGLAALRALATMK